MLLRNIHILHITQYIEPSLRILWGKTALAEVLRSPSALVMAEAAVAEDDV